MEVVTIDSPLEVVLPEVLMDAKTWVDEGRRSLHAGCGGNLLPGFLNSDIVRLQDPAGKTTRLGALFRAGKALYFEHDATKPFPLPAAFFDVVFSEHFIEHIPHAAALPWAKEIHRLMKPGATLRISTPSLALYVDAYRDPAQTFFKAHAEVIRPVAPEVQPRRGWMMNQIFYAWHHRFIYDFEELAVVLAEAGFDRAQMSECTFRKGRIESLAARDLAERADESLYLEAVR